MDMNFALQLAVLESDLAYLEQENWMSYLEVHYFLEALRD